MEKFKPLKEHMTLLVTVVVFSCVVKFLMEGVTFDVLGHAVNLGHADSLTYGALLSPIMAAHGYMAGKYKPETPACNEEDGK